MLRQTKFNLNMEEKDIRANIKVLEDDQVKKKESAENFKIKLDKERES